MKGHVTGRLILWNVMLHSFRVFMESNQMISRAITTQPIKGAFLEEQFGRKVWPCGCDWVAINMNKNIDVVYIKNCYWSTRGIGIGWQLYEIDFLCFGGDENLGSGIWTKALCNEMCQLLFIVNVTHEYQYCILVELSLNLPFMPFAKRRL